MVASTVVSQLLARWAHLYGHTPVRASVTYLHLVGILVWGAGRGRRGGSRLAPPLACDVGLVRGSWLAGRCAPLGGSRPRLSFLQAVC